MSDEIILYDLPSKGTPRCWSLNPWKARLALNFKGLPYKTQWLEYPSVAPTLQSYSIPPNSPTLNPNAAYSIPAIRLPPTSSSPNAGPTYTMDSLAIADALECHYPSPQYPSLFLSSPYAAHAQTAINKLWSALQALALPRVPDTLLNPASADYINSTREERFGMPLSSLARSEKAQPGHIWGPALDGKGGSAEEGLRMIQALLAEKEGTFIQGAEASFADFIFAACFRFLEILDREGDLFDRVMGFDELIRRHYEACRPWLERDD